MKERPILFSAPMVRAILEGRKTQTRRVCKSQPYGNGFMAGNELVCHNDYLPPSVMLMDVGSGKNRYTTSDAEGWEASCPYGVPGDRLWVRETLGTECYASKRWDSVWYDVDSEDVENVPADWAPPRRSIRQHQETGDNIPEGGFPYWTAKVPSIFMPRWASRINLEVTGVRIERLQDISEEDAAAEGVESLDSSAHEERTEHDPSLCNNCGGLRLYMDGSSGAARFDVDCRQCDTYVQRYRWLWEAINGPESWAANPWVWVIEFPKVPQP